MERDRKLIDYLPEILRRLKEFRLIMAAEDPELDLLWAEYDSIVDNLYITSCDEAALVRYEKMFGILASPSTESVGFRKKRLLTRMSTQLPFTYRWLLTRLDVLYGQENFDVAFEPDDYTLDIRIKLGSKNLLALVKEFTEAVVPANMVLTVELIFNTWETLHTYTWNQLASYTWSQVKEEVLT